MYINHYQSYTGSDVIFTTIRKNSLHQFSVKRTSFMPFAKNTCNKTKHTLEGLFHVYADAAIF